jgi:hypothetical protein
VDRIAPQGVANQDRLESGYHVTSPRPAR